MEKRNEKTIYEFPLSGINILTQLVKNKIAKC